MTKKIYLDDRELLRKENNNNLIEEWAKFMKRSFKEVETRTNSHERMLKLMKLELQILATMRPHFTPINVTKSLKPDDIKCLQEH